MQRMKTVRTLAGSGNASQKESDNQSPGTGVSGDGRLKDLQEATGRCASKKAPVTALRKNDG
jgi:hypothetical protein